MLEMSRGGIAPSIFVTNEALVLLLALLQLRISYASPAGPANVIARIILLCACVAHAVTSLLL